MVYNPPPRNLGRRPEPPDPPPPPPEWSRAQRADEHFSRRTFDARCGYCARVTRLLHSGEACPNCGARDWSAAVLTRAATPLESTTITR